MSKEKIIKQMVNSFLSWKLPEDLIPDGGITYKKIEGFSPIGTNLLTATQAEAMVRHMLSHVGVSDLVATDSSQEPPLESAQSNKADTNDIAELLTKLFEDLYSVPYHPTDLDACGLHEKHTPQCYACRHAKWSNIIKAELRERFDRLNALQELKKWAAQETNKARQETNKARIDELERMHEKSFHWGNLKSKSYKGAIAGFIDDYYERIQALTADKEQNNG